MYAVAISLFASSASHYLSLYAGHMTEFAKFLQRPIPTHIGRVFDIFGSAK